MLYERRHHRLLTWQDFVRRALRHFLLALLILLGGVGIGTAGYHGIGGLPWVDAFLNASMILSGMGPVNTLTSTAAKLFAAFYALFSGLMFVAIAGLIMAPWLHRLFHWIHLEEPRS